MQNISRKTGFIILILVILLSSCAVYFISGNTFSSSKIVYSSPSNVTNVSDDRKLSGIAHNVFIGEVNAQIGNKKLGNYPESQFKVEVLQNIKGSLNGSVTVNQQGGYDWNRLMLIQGDRLLEVGKTYLFATRINQEQNWHTLIPEYGDIPIDSDVKRKDLIERFTKAHKEEIPFK